MEQTKRMYIGGRLVEGDSIRDVINPATNKLVGRVAVAGAQGVENALRAAEAAYPMWSCTSIAERADWMSKLRDAVIENEERLRDCVHHEMGKSWSGTEEDFTSLKNSLHFYAEEISRVRPEMLVDRAGTHTHTLLQEAVGVVVAFIAWNFPLLNLAFKIGPAMATGCPIIIKPSSATPLSAYLVGELCEQIGLPAGVVNIVGTASSADADALSASTIPSMLSLIGSSATGCHIMKTGATSIKRYSMELGGNAPVLVFADADLDLAADIVCAVKFGNSGQICVTPNRVFVEESVSDLFSQKVVERARAVKVGFAKDAAIDMGPLIDGKAWRRVDGLVKDAISSGAKLLTGGGRVEGLSADLSEGHFFAPTVLSGVREDMRLYREEIFGPVVSLLSFTDKEQVLLQANDSDSGLTAYVFTRDLGKADDLSRRLRYGEIHINGIKYGIDLPHGGIGQSGIGHDCSHLALHEYLAVKRVSRSLAA